MSVGANKRTITISDDVTPANAVDGGGMAPPDAESQLALSHISSALASTHVFTFDRVYVLWVGVAPACASTASRRSVPSHAHPMHG